VAGADLVHVEGFFLMQHVPPETRTRVLLVEQNIEFALWRQRAELGEREAAAEATLTLESEREAWSRADLVATVTEDDREAILEELPALDVRVVPDGVDHLRAKKTLDVERGLIVFVANFGYAPNVDAGLHLVSELWPAIKSKVPRARLALVGGGVPAVLGAAASSQQDVSLTGRVASVVPFLDAAEIVVCPLRVGGGVKVKVLEALSRGKALVTTGVGAQGLRPGIEGAALIKDSPEEFAQAVVTLLASVNQRRSLETAAKKFAQELPSWDTASMGLACLFRELLRERSLLHAVDLSDDDREGPPILPEISRAAS